MAQESLPFRRIPATAILGLVSVAVLSVLGYLLAARMTFRLGFPLDDAWIHQTYARNLAFYGEWSFLPHETSGGSTAPLWSALLAPGFLLGLSPLVWTYLLGTVLLTSLAIFTEFILRRMVDGYRPRIPWAGIFILLEWHLVWAAVSGMETLLAGLLITLVLGALVLEFRNYLPLGMLIGVAIWVRPDTITLVGPVVLVILLTGAGWGTRWRSLTGFLIGFGVILAVYFLFNLVVSGTPFPNTFYAKQAEYAVLQQAPLGTRFFNLFLLPQTGAGIVLLPGALILAVRSIRNRQWGILSGMIWFAGYLLLYAWRLPVTYQHGRYVMPAMPIYFIWGLAGLMAIANLPSGSRWRWRIVKAWQISAAVALVAFWTLGARAYAVDVAVIESEMVTTARWVAKNLPPDAVIAAHDIGALGYFAPGNLLDLAGLINPEVIPFIRDEGQLSRFLDQKHAAYLITFPDWYPRLVKGHPLVFTSDGPFAPQMGQKNMAVYSWTAP